MTSTYRNWLIAVVIIVVLIIVAYFAGVRVRFFSTPSVPPSSLEAHAGGSGDVKTGPLVNSGSNGYGAYFGNGTIGVVIYTGQPTGPSAPATPADPNAPSGISGYDNSGAISGGDSGGASGDSGGDVGGDTGTTGGDTGDSGDGDGSGGGGGGGFWKWIESLIKAD